jgi:hypothetical protein
MPKRIRRDVELFELRHARVRVCRKPDLCILCGEPIGVKHVYARTSETRLPVCSAHFTLDDVTETYK